MSLSDKAREARAHADTCINPACHALANAFEAAITAVARDQLRELEPEQATTRLPTPREAGFPDALNVERPDPPQ